MELDMLRDCLNLNHIAINMVNLESCNLTIAHVKSPQANLAIPNDASYLDAESRGT